MSKKLCKTMYFLVGFFIVLGIFGNNQIVHADTESTNLITGSNDFSGSKWDLWFSPEGSLGLKYTIETDSDGDTAWHLTGTATSDGNIGIFNQSNLHTQPSPGVLSLYIKGSIGTNTTLWTLEHEGTDTVSEYANLSDLQTDRYIRFYNQYVNNSGSTTAVYSADTFYLHVKTGDTFNLWIKHMKLESGSTMGYDETTIASGTDGTSKWTLDNNGVLSFGAGTLDRDETQSILKEYNGDVTSITTANADGKVVFPADSSYIFKDPTLDSSYLKASNITWMENSYDTKSVIKSIDLSNADTSNVTNFSGMFVGNEKMTSLSGLSSFDTSKATDMSFMFYMNDSLTSADVGSWNLSNVTNMWKMFAWDYDLQSLDVSKWDVSKAVNLNCLFQGTTSLKTLDVSNWDVSNATNLGWMFGDMPSLQSLDVSKWDTSKNTDLSRMFWNDTSLKTLDVSNWDTSHVKAMTYTFAQTALTSLDLSKWSTSSATNMTYMFYNNAHLATLDLSRFDMPKVVDMSYMFAACPALTSLNLSSFDTSAVTTMASMFLNDSSLTSLDLSSFDTSVVTNMNNMFSGMTSLQTLNLSNFNTTKASTTDILKNDTKLSKLSVAAKTTLTSTSLPEFKWVNSVNLSNYYPTTSALFVNPVAGTYKLYTSPTIIKTSPINLTLTSGDDMSQVSLGITNALSYQTNDAAKTTFSMALGLLSGKAYSINSPFSGVSSLASSASGVVNTVTSSTENTTSQELPFSKSSTIDLSALKYWYAGTYTTTITYTIDDNY